MPIERAKTNVLSDFFRKQDEDKAQEMSRQMVKEYVSTPPAPKVSDVRPSQGMGDLRAAEATPSTKQSSQGGGLLGAFKNFGKTLKMGAMLAPAAVRSTTRKVNEAFNPDNPHADYENAFTAGIGDVYSSAGGAAKWLGARDAGTVLGGVGKTLQQQGENVPEGLGYDVARAVPFTLSLIPATVAAGLGGAEIAGAAGLGALGTGITGAVSGALASRSLEGLLEAGGTYEDALYRGMSEEVADAAAKSVYVKNMALTGMDAGEIIVALAPVKGFGKIAQAVNRTRAGRVSVGAGRIVGTAGLEAGEEGIQEVFQRQALGDPIALDDQMKKAMTIGGVMGGGMGAAGTGYHSLKTAFENYGQKTAGTPSATDPAQRWKDIVNAFKVPQGQPVQPAAQPVPVKPFGTGVQGYSINNISSPSTGRQDYTGRTKWQIPQGYLNAPPRSGGNVTTLPIAQPRAVRSGAINLSGQVAVPPVTTTKPVTPVVQEPITAAPVQQSTTQPRADFTVGEKVEWIDLSGNAKPGTVFSVDGENITVTTDKGGRVPLKPDRVRKINQQGAPAAEPVSSSLPEVPAQTAKEPWEMPWEEFKDEFLLHGTVTKGIEEIRPYSFFSADPRRTLDYAKTGRPHPFDTKPKDGGEVLVVRRSDDPSFAGSRIQYQSSQGLKPIARVPESEAHNPHRYVIQQALSEGKPVPQEVLADYPELVNQEVKDIRTEAATVPTAGESVSTGTTTPDITEKPAQEGAGGVTDVPEGKNYVSNKDGNSLTLYHGTPVKFDKFDKSKIGSNYGITGARGGKGIYFTDSLEEAKYIAEENFGKFDNPQPNVIKANLSIDSPLRVVVPETTRGFKGGVFTGGSRDPSNYFDSNASKLFKQAKKNKNDGIIVTGEVDGKEVNTYIVFDPDQINTIGATQEDAGGPVKVTLADYSLSLRKTTTKNGNTAWEVQGDTYHYKDNMGRAGGRYYKPHPKARGIWTFYGDADPTDRILKNMAPPERKAEAAPAGVQASVKQEVMPSKEPQKEKAPAAWVGIAKNIRAQAQAMQKTIDTKRNPAIANQNHTARRANIAAGMAKEADHLELIQSKLSAVADALESGTLPESLNKLTKKTQVEALEKYLNRAKYRREREQKVSYQDSKDTPVSEKDIAFASFEDHAHPSHLKDLLQATENMKGVKDARAAVQRVISREGKVYSFEELDAIEALIKKAEQTGKGKGFDKYIRDELAEFKRLREMGIESTDQLQQALKDYLSLGVERKGPTKEQKIKELERQLIGSKIPGYFPTPRAVVEEMIEAAEIEPGMSVLEPSAGKGNIADIIREKEPGAELGVIELQKSLRDVLEAKEYNVLSETDFMQYNPEKKYDRIVMNPPFERGQDVDHVKHAYELLKPGGRLVSIMSEGPFFRGDKKATAFREWMDELEGTNEKLPEKSFTGKGADRQTGVAARMVVIKKAAARVKTKPEPKQAETHFTPEELAFIKKAKKNHAPPATLFRGMEQAEFEDILEKGYIKSKGEYNFSTEKGRTLYGDNYETAEHYASGFAPKPVAEKFFKQGKKAYVIEIANTPEIKMGRNRERLGDMESKKLDSYWATEKNVSIGNIIAVTELSSKDGNVQRRQLSKDELKSMGILPKKEITQFSQKLARDKETGTLFVEILDDHGNSTGRYVLELPGGGEYHLDPTVDINDPDSPVNYKRLGFTGELVEVSGPKETPKMGTGNTTTAKTERGTKIKAQYAVVEARDLIASHDTDMVTNEAYPSEIQPRQRERLTSEDQINRILANLEPEFLGESPKASDGAPIVGPDMVVESGNGRVIALQKGYQSKHDSISKYRQWLSDNTEKFGLNKEIIEKAKNPVLVRVRQTEVDRVKFAQETNEQSVAAMSATEQAVVDAKKLTHGLLETFAPGESGEILVRSNMPFITSFMEQVVNPAERGRYIAADGSVSQEGATRIRNAVYAKAYGDIFALEKLAESTDNNVRTITSAMLTVAPRMAVMKDAIETGALYPLDITGDIAAAMNKLSALREAGDTVEIYLKQGNLFEEELSPIAKDLLDVFDKYKRSGKKLTEILNYYIDGVEAAGDPRQGILFGQDTPSKADVIQVAIKRVGGPGVSQTSLFQDEPAGNVKTGIPDEKAGAGKEAPASKAGEKGELKPSPLEQVQEEMNRKIDEEIGDVNPPAGFSIKLVSKPPATQQGRGLKKGYSFDDPEIEERFQAANGMPEESLYDKVKAAFKSLINRAHREYEHLPRNAEFAELRKDLLKLAKQRGVAGDKTLRLQQGITINLDPNKFDIFRRYVILSDLMEEMEAGHSLPFGFTEESLQKEWDRINTEADKYSEIRKSIDDRAKIWKAIISEYTSNMRAIGFNVDNRFTKESYYRHQVIEYAKLKGRAMTGTGQKLKTPTGRGFLKQRGGSEMDINTNYLQAEYEVMAQMLYDVEVARTIKAVDDNYNIQKRLKQEAKSANNRAINEIIARGDELAALVDGSLKKFRQKIAMSFSGLQTAAKRGELWTGEKGEYEDVVDYLKDGSQGDYYANRLFDVDEGRFKGPLSSGRLFKYLSDLLVREDVGSSQAATILKAVGQRREFIKEALGKNFKTWEDMIPDGYIAWQPREGNVFFMSETIPGHLAEKLFTDQVEQLGISKEDLNRALTIGGRRKEFVVKEEIAATLDNLTKPTADDLLHKAMSEPLRMWKVWQLLSPRRWFKYNFRNISGDAEAVFIGNPRAFAKLPRAAKELYEVFAGDKSMTADMQGWFERGGMQTLLQVQELGEINNLRMFLKLQEKKGSAAKIPLKAWQGYWKAVRLSTDYREALLRYASYLSYLEQMEKNGGQPKNYGASIPEEVMALKDNKDRAFKLQNELLGAYDEISVIGQGLRKYLMPFWSWNEVNFRRTIQLMKNAARDEKLTYAVGRKLIGAAAIRTPFLAMRVGKFVLMAAAMWTVLTLWNNMRFPEEEKELPNDVKGRPHIVFGRDKDGKILYFDRLGFVQDFLSWFGLDQVPLTAKDLINGKMTPKEFAVEAVKAPAIKLMQSLGPHIKLPFEEAFGYKTYPDFFKPGRIRDRWQYLAESFGLGNEYNQLTGKPVQTIEGSRGKGYFGTLRDVFVYSRDSGQSAYYDILDEKRRYMEKINKLNEGSFTSPKSEALYNFKLSLRYKDKEAARKYLLEYAMLGGTAKGLAQSLKTMDPLFGLNDEEKIAFVVSLNTEDRQKLVRALQYYQTVLLGK